MNHRQDSEKRWWDALAALLLLAALQTSASRLVSTRWTADLSTVQTLAFLGWMAGLALGQSRFSIRRVRWFSLVYGAFFIPWQLGLTLREADLLWGERLAILLNRLATIFSQLSARQQVQDSLLFLVLMYTLFWLLALLAGYTLTRHGDPWKAVLPAGLALLVIHSFDSLIPSRTWYLAVYLFFALCLVGRLTYLQHRSQWQAERAALPPNLNSEFIRYTLIIAFLMLAFAWSTPALAQALPAAQKAWLPVQQRWERLRQSWEDAFAPLRGTVGITASAYGPNARLGLGTPQSLDEVLLVKPPPSAPQTLRFYWRARTYDTYESGQWYSTINRREPYLPSDTSLPLPSDGGRWAGSFELFSYQALATYLVPAQPLWLNRAGQIEFAENPDGTLDISVIRPTQPLRPGQIYNVQAAVVNATEAELRLAGVEYPQWVRERYLQLPENLTPRTRQLAIELIAGQDNPYDKTNAIINYLRLNYKYVNQLEKGPPPDAEPVDWFLFEAKQGFCNYYSTAAIVMLRSVGIPARWAVGFAEGEFTENGGYLVRQKDSHSWPEVYFPGIGWVEFEPTASQPEIARLPGTLPGQGQDSTRPENDLYEKRLEYQEQLNQLEQERRTQGVEPAQKRPAGWLPGLISALLAAGLIGLIVYLQRRGKLPELPRPRWATQPLPVTIERLYFRLGLQPPALVRHWARRATLTPLAKAYLAINDSLQRIGQTPPPALTPQERADLLGQHLPPAAEPAQLLTREYIRNTYSRASQADLSAAQASARQINRLSWQAWLRRRLERFQQPEPPAARLQKRR